MGRVIGRVTDIRVIDGDSIECRIDGRTTNVRLHGIDAPENEQLGGPDAADGLNRMLLGYVPPMVEVMAVDRYGRDVGLLYSRRGNSQDSVNARMVREGLAYAYTRFGGAELGLTAAQSDARAVRRGVWRASRAGGERPWDYRRRVREGPVPDSLLFSLLIGTRLGRVVLMILLAALLVGALLVETCDF